ncbi:MAG TPA: DUF3870 domain-containing protein [Candidatus Dormibacteraeota bacterium]|nr:DUF3870 domain-containing protein [Candidatus Dormibacteraeota bacterium]
MSGEGTRGTVIVAGDARAPVGSGIDKVYGHIGVVLEIEPSTDVIVAADAVFVTELAREFVSSLLVGHALSEGLGSIRKEIGERVLFASQGALLSALQIAYQRYHSYKTREVGEGPREQEA